ncbi:MAG: FdtA/QdtA family cupin domain-containing protein [Flavobacteriales bacterium]|nr:FdtA/QdtA family cupin domain-containing protein [Flavobacteriales bacterium]MCB0770307.1 FdtA/QdtA family cupin domain-containing protein [Flavobacteriales bacterium]
MAQDIPQLAHLPLIGSPKEGYIAVATANGNVPFAVKRVFWTFRTPTSVQRGGHAHKRTRQVLVAMAGKVSISAETSDGRTFHFTLDDPGVGLYLPELCWRTLRFTKDAVLMVLASTDFERSDYINDLGAFRKLNKIR